MGSNVSKRNALFTTLSYLMLRAPQELVQVDQNILCEFFTLSSHIEDDDNIKENVLWL